MTRKSRDGAKSSSKSIESRLWEAYWADRSDANRNAIVEHYLPWVRMTARRFIGHRPIDDKPVMLADVLLAFVANIVPGFQGQSAFKTYAHAAIYRRIVDLSEEQERRQMESIYQEREPDGKALADTIAAPEKHECRLCETLRLMPRAEAIALWMRYCLDMKFAEIEAVLGYSPPNGRKFLQHSETVFRKLILNRSRSTV